MKMKKLSKNLRILFTIILSLGASWMIVETYLGLSNAIYSNIGYDLFRIFMPFVIFCGLVLMIKYVWTGKIFGL